MFFVNSAHFYNRLLFIASFVFLFSCKGKKEPRQIERSFYYWRSVLDLTGFEKQALDSLDIKTIYLKFFDVDWNGSVKAPMPVAKLTVNEASIASLRQGGTYDIKFNIIPVIFITNECISKIDTSQIVTLA